MDKQPNKFQKGNEYAAMGGRARARPLSARRRKLIAKSGWEALVAKRFHGNEAIAKEYMRALARYNGDPYRDDPELSFGHPRPELEEYTARSWAISMQRELDFERKSQ